MPSTSGYNSGDWKVVCDVCGREFRAHQLTQRWDGLMTCKDDWESRQPQDFVRGVADKIVPPWLRPQQGNTVAINPDGTPVPGSGGDTFIGGPGSTTPISGPGGTGALVCDSMTKQPVAGVGTAGCMTVGYTIPCTLIGKTGIIGVGVIGCMIIGLATPPQS